MEGPALADAQPIKAGAPDSLITWESDSLEPPTAADTSAAEVFLEDGGAEEVCDAPAEAKREASDPFVRILEKVGAPPALLKGQTQAGGRPTQEGLNKSQMQPPSPAIALQEMPAESHATEITALHTESKLAESSQPEAQGARESSADTTVAVPEAECARSNSGDIPECINALQLEELTKAVEVDATSDKLHHGAASCFNEEDGSGGAFSAVPRPTESQEKARDTPPTPSELGTPSEDAQASGEKQENKRGSSDSSVSSGSVDATHWPFESGLRPWEDVGKETRKAAEGISNHQLEDHQKTRIWVIHRGVCTPVSWYVDTSAEDVKTSILCACDVLADEEQLEDQGKTGGFCLRQIRPLPDSAEVDCDELFMGVKTLTLRCALPPSDAREGLLLQGLVIGQKSATFMGYRIPALQHLSFSLVFRGDECPSAFSTKVELPETCLEDARTLDLTCKDEFEFDAWVTGCKAIIAANKGLKLSKMNLLSHSRRFLKAVQKCDTTVQLTKLPEVKERAGLQDCMDLPWHPPEELERKYEEQRKRVVAVAEEMRSLDKKTVVRSNVDISVLVGAGPAYANILGDSAEVDDEEMEFERMRELLKEVIDVLNTAKAKLTEYRAAESARRKSEEEAAAATQEAASSSSSAGNTEDTAEAAAAPQASEESSELPALPEGLEKTAILAISSGGQVLMKSGAPGLTFDERFKMASSSTAPSIDLEAVQEQMKEGLTALLQRAASQTAEAQQLFSSALAAAAAAVGVDTEQQTAPPQTLPPEDEGVLRCKGTLLRRVGCRYNQLTGMVIVALACVSEFEQIEKLKSINQLLWRAEVDVENIEDMLERLQAPSGFGGLALAGTVANLNQMVTEQVNKWGGQLASMMTGFLQRADVPHLVQSTGPQVEPRLVFTDSECEDDLI
ncbi:hypothetical protein Emed_000601 [Eimeria media]